MRPRFSAAAGLALAIVFLGFAVLFVGERGGQAASITHTCTVTDRAFIGAAQSSLGLLGATSSAYLDGDAKADDVLAQTKDALADLGHTKPQDPSLATTQKILRSMFREYGRAIRAHAHNQPPGKHIYRAYGLANFAHDILSQAAPALERQGCDVSPLL